MEGALSKCGTFGCKSSLYSFRENLSPNLLRLVKKLLAEGADVEAPLKASCLTFAHRKGMSILNTAMCLSSPEVIDLLLHSGANPFGGCAENPPLFGITAFADNSENVRTFLKFVEKQYARGKSAKPISYVNQVYQLGFTTFLFAAGEGRVNVCRELHEEWNCDLLATNVADRDALSMAATSCDSSSAVMLKYLLELRNEVGDVLFPVNRSSKVSRMSE